MSGQAGRRRGRWTAALLAALLVGDGLAWMAVQQAAADDWRRCLDERAGACVGEHAVLPLQIVYEVGEATAVVGRPVGRVTVRGEDPALVEGAEVTIEGTYGAGGVFVLEAVHAHPLRPWKRWLGLAGVGILAVLLPLTLTVRRTDEGWRVVPRG